MKNEINEIKQIRSSYEEKQVTKLYIEVTNYEK